MNINALAKATVPVIVGVIVAGLLLNALRDTDFFRNAIRGFDS